jgi:peptidylprolyl isomerase
LKACNALVALLLVGAVGCSGSVRSEDTRSAEEVVTGLTVSGEPGTAPVVRMRAPLKIDETTSAVTAEGTGAPIQVDQLFVIELSIFDARTGKAAVSRLALAAKSTDDQLFPKLSEALVGVREGSRLVLAATAADAFAGGGVPPSGVERADPVVVVADVVAVPPVDVLDTIDGRPVPAVPHLPELVATQGVPTAISFTHVTPVREPRAYPLVEGSGPAVTKHDLITVDYLAQRSRQDDPFEDTFFKEPVQVAIGTGTAPPGWDEFLVGVHRGSRLVIYGPDKDGMIAWVVDVLGVS